MEIELDGQRYLCGRMPTRTQWHVALRLLPAAGAFVPLMNGGLEGEDPVQFGVMTLARAMPALNPADVDFVIDAALDATKFYSHGGWAPLRANGGGLMCQAADMFDTQIRIVWEVLNESLRNFSFEKLRLSPTETVIPTASN